MELLKFQFGNAKLSNSIAYLNLPAGWSCPGAKECLSKYDPKTNKLTDGKDTLFRCFGAVSERFPSVQKVRWHNYNLLRKEKTLDGLITLITNSLPDKPYIRPHSDGGDFYNEMYFLAWLNLAISNPNQVFYTYTKMPQFIVKFRKDFPPNFRLTASFGGKYDELIHKHNLKYAKVVFSRQEAKDLNLEIDKDDSHAFNGSKQPFALLLHGVQPANTQAAKQLREIKKENKVLTIQPKSIKVFVR